MSIYVLVYIDIHWLMPILLTKLFHIYCIHVNFICFDNPVDCGKFLGFPRTLVMQSCLSWQALDTSTYNAADRIRQFGDFVGVTDRYTGYRHNLTRGSREPVRMEPKWADKTRQTEYINTLNSTRPWTGKPAVIVPPCVLLYTSITGTYFWFL